MSPSYGEELAARMPQQQVVDVVIHTASPWFFGRYDWVLKEAHAMPFAAYRGQLGLFAVPVSILPYEVMQRWS